ncbi:hypothetical protein LSAT2_026222 [Lamellibrachia satsuma]|nr:hypothetical protein LSAT2_026222 [Lamellibrachia satsuma]
MLSWYTIYDHTIYARWGPVHLADTKLIEKTASEVHAAFIDGNFVVKRTKRCFSPVAADQATEWMDRTYKMQNGAIGISHPSTMPGSNSLVRPTWVWRCYPQLEMPSNFTLYAPTTRQISGAGRPETYRCLIVYQHIGLDEGDVVPGEREWLRPSQLIILTVPCTIAVLFLAVVIGMCVMPACTNPLTGGGRPALPVTRLGPCNARVSGRNINLSPLQGSDYAPR